MDAASQSSPDDLPSGSAARIQRLVEIKDNFSRYSPENLEELWAPVISTVRNHSRSRATNPPQKIDGISYCASKSMARIELLSLVVLEVLGGLINVEGKLQTRPGNRKIAVSQKGLEEWSEDAFEHIEAVMKDLERVREQIRAYLEPDSGSW